VRRVTFHSFDEVRDEIVAALELHVDVRPGVVALSCQANEIVVHPDQEND
jgi:hypothetical protein